MAFIRVVRSALTAPLLVAAMPGAAQSSSTPPGDFIFGAWSNPAKCNSTNARHLTVIQLVEAGAALNRQCVAVEGFWTGQALFDRASDANKKRSIVTPELRDRRVGLYARDEILESAPRRARRYTMVGIVGQCETEWPGAAMVLGYCHYTGGPIIIVADVLSAKNDSQP